MFWLIRHDGVIKAAVVKGGQSSLGTCRRLPESEGGKNRSESSPIMKADTTLNSIYREASETTKCLRLLIFSPFPSDMLIVTDEASLTPLSPVWLHLNLIFSGFGICPFLLFYFNLFHFPLVSWVFDSNIKGSFSSAKLSAKDFTWFTTCIRHLGETSELIQLIVCRADSFLNSLLQLTQLKNMKDLDPSNETSIHVKPVRLKEREKEKNMEVGLYVWEYRWQRPRGAWMVK